MGADADVPVDPEAVVSVVGGRRNTTLKNLNNLLSISFVDSSLAKYSIYPSNGARAETSEGGRYSFAGGLNGTEALNSKRQVRVMSTGYSRTPPTVEGA